MQFNLNDNQHGTLVCAGKNDDGVARPVTALSAQSANEAIVTVAPNPGFPDQFGVTAHGVAGSVDVTVTGTNAGGQPVTGVATFLVAGTDATGFTFTLINVAAN